VTPKPEQPQKPRKKYTSREFFQNHQTTFKALVIFVASIALFFFILISHALDRYLVYPFTSLVAQTSSLILNLAGYDTVVKGTFLTSTGASLNIGTGCNGLEAVIIFISAILAFPARLKSKLLGLLWGFLGIFIINQTRVIGLYLVSRYASQHLDLAHTYIGQTYVIISGVALWILWAERVSNVSKKTSLTST
jgi:exosortase H (IPTLxxWG-CTERM-specific)